jgi:hypothetical protein
MTANEEKDNPPKKQISKSSKFENHILIFNINLILAMPLNTILDNLVPISSYQEKATQIF